MQLSCIIVDTDAANRQEMAAFLTERGVSVAALLPAIDALPALLAPANAPRLVVVNIDPVPEETLQKIGPWIQQFPNVNFFVMSETIEASLIMDAMHLGVKDFITLPVNQPKLIASIERIASREGLDKRAKIIHVIPTIGGCGATTVACNVAAALAKNAKSVLIDLDLVRGGVTNAFDVHPRYSIADVTDTAVELDDALVDNALAIHRGSKLAILGRPETPEDSQRVSKQGFLRLLSVVGRMFDYVLIDSLMSLDPLYAGALHAADTNLLVMQLNIPSARNTERFVGALRRMGIDQSKIKVVANRFVKKGWDIDPAEVEKALGLKISWTIPNDFKNAIDAINFGEPVVLRSPRAQMSDSLQGLMQMLNGKASRN